MLGRRKQPTRWRQRVWRHLPDARSCRALQRARQRRTRREQVPREVVRQKTRLSRHELLIVDFAGPETALSDLASLDERMSGERESLNKLKHERDALRIENERLSSQQGFASSTLLVQPPMRSGSVTVSGMGSCREWARQIGTGTTPA